MFLFCHYSPKNDQGSFAPSRQKIRDLLHLCQKILGYSRRRQFYSTEMNAKKEAHAIHCSSPTRRRLASDPVEKKLSYLDRFKYVPRTHKTRVLGTGTYSVYDTVKSNLKEAIINRSDVASGSYGTERSRRIYSVSTPTT